MGKKLSFFHISACSVSALVLSLSSSCTFYLFVYRETNLKVRQPIPETAEMKEDEEYLAHFDGETTVHFHLHVISHANHE